MSRGRCTSRAARVVVAIALLAAGIGGCAGARSQVAGVGGSSALPAARDLVGTWHGRYGQVVGMAYYLDDADCTLQIRDDATYTATCKRSPFGANNLAKSSSWSGPVVTRGDDVILEHRRSPWPTIVLDRARHGELHGVTLDPQVGATVQMDFEPDGAAASPAGN
ncbi:MAG TPA: hypothetical protein VHZ49_00240 [Methylomirabilota bacterium]|nr:hypothetical protein [Methylomirabilota bacterium]